VQVDDGYQAGIGDWLTPNEKFPHGMGWIAERIHKQGYKAGLWLAPFMIGADSQLWKDHPDWAVQYPSASLRAGKPGKPYVAMINWAQECYAMDLTRPDVMEWLEDVFNTVFNVWRYDYIKIDFLYAGAVDGIRHDPNITRAQAYRRAIEKIRNIAGARFVLGCGHPMGPSIGLMNGSRISPDVAPFWYPHEPPREERRSDLSTVSTFNALRNTLVRSWMHNRIWLNDPDCMLARDTDTALTLHEVRTLATVIGLSGGMMLDSDNLTKLSDERRDMLSMLMPVDGRSAVPLDLFESETPQRFELDCETHRLLGVFNWADAPAEVVAPLPAEASHVFEVWQQRYLGVIGGSVTAEIPPHGCRLYAVRPVSARPQVVGSTFHLLQGAVEIAREEWDGTALRISLRSVARAEVKLFLHVGRLDVPSRAHRFRSGAASGQSVSVWTRRPISGSRASPAVRPTGRRGLARPHSRPSSGERRSPCSGPAAQPQVQAFDDDDAGFEVTECTSCFFRPELLDRRESIPESTKPRSTSQRAASGQAKSVLGTHRPPEAAVACLRKEAARAGGEPESGDVRSRDVPAAIVLDDVDGPHERLDR
jgi:alpha-galactosidase